MGDYRRGAIGLLDAMQCSINSCLSNNNNEDNNVKIFSYSAICRIFKYCLDFDSSSGYKELIVKSTWTSDLTSTTSDFQRWIGGKNGDTVTR